MNAGAPLFFLLIFCLTHYQNSPAQPSTTLLSMNCEDLIRLDADSLNGAVMRSAAHNIVVPGDGKKSLTFFVVEMDGVIVLSVSVLGAGDCVDDKSKVRFTFRNGSSLELINSGGFNCDAESSVYFGGGFGHKKELEKFLTVEIDRVWVETRKSTIDKSKPAFVEASFSPDQSKLFMKTIDCLRQ